MTMRYDDMLQLYPHIEELFAAVADQIHAGVAPAQAAALIAIRVDKEIGQPHRNAVRDKLMEWAKVVRDNKTPLTLTAPDPCPHCGSIEASAGRCGWCHRELAG